ncbi:MAG: tRNA (adenosine(37)-N6)-threonylcarbamoyltransferase complex transferase subunit TsaD [Candidatus Omnitrophica bacterium]|nr:tRNA (adenosine(37)-N6)-threonylcarbamoyltransferase complex transferase subunit TsaD [Candidatus Omnitrophota bacterium]
MKILGIETSCDETSTAIVENGTTVLSSTISSSIDWHKKYGGIVPEIATRHHVEVIAPILKESLAQSGLSLEEIDAIAVTQGPGLIGSLIIGIAFAKSLSLALKKPIIPVDHILAHIYSACMDNVGIKFPYLGLAASGGHSSIFIINDFDDFRLIGKTRDDALGESFDKVAKMLNLGFPGGPEIEKRAAKALNKKMLFNPPEIKNSYDLSYSGLKTAVLYYIKKQKQIEQQEIDSICFGFQEAAFQSLIKKLELAVLNFNTDSLAAGGGVTANSRLREMLKGLGIKLYLPALKYCSDNAAMVAGLAFRLYNKTGSGNIDFGPYSVFEEKWKP